jgi:hypothetical protein
MLTGAAFLPRVLHSLGLVAKQPVNEYSPSSSLTFKTTDAQYQSTYAAALDVLARNVRVVSGYSEPVLMEGSSYLGIWLEGGPHEGLVYSTVRPDLARNNHLVFLALQRPDGQLPCLSTTSEIGFGQIQMVVPIAATAWELSRQTADSELLEKSYSGCSRWDAWLRRYRDTRHSGLCEGFCTWDTGHDNSPRWAGMPNRCPDSDARKCPPVPSLPRLCPDLSATVYGGRVALAAMARALGKNSEAEQWLSDAAAIRNAILTKLYSPGDASFYDLDAHQHFVRVRGDAISRVLGEHVVDQRLFDSIYARQIHNPQAFWAPYPLPSIALDDSSFVRPIPPNSWGGASQALTALRAPRWMEHYGKPADLAHLMRQWIGAIARQSKFLQQMDPLDGTYTPDAGGYSPAALVFLDFTWRLSGVRRVEDYLEWNVRPPAHTTASVYRLRVSSTGIAEIKYSSGHADLFLNGRPLFQTSNIVRLVTSLEGKLKSANGVALERTAVLLLHASGEKQAFSIDPNEKRDLAGNIQ